MEFPADPDWIYAGTEYSAYKVIWIAAPSYDGPVLVRGFEIDGHRPVRFTVGHSPGRSLTRDDFLVETYSPPNTADFGPVQHGWRELDSDMRRIVAVKGPGCYAWQVGGTNFSESIVFRVVDATP